MIQVRVIDEEHSYVTEYADPEEKWDRDSTGMDHHIKGIREGIYGDLTADFELEEGKTYYLLYVIYDTGDSFGRDEGRIEFVGLYQDEKVARENQQRIEIHTKNEEALGRWSSASAKERKKIAKTHNSYSVGLVTESGQEYQFHACWHGYFEQVQGVDIEPVMVI